MAKRKLVVEPEATIRYELIGHTLAGRQVAGRWEFVCPDCPDLVRRHNGSASPAGIIGEFTTRCIFGSATIRAIATN